MKHSVGHRSVDHPEVHIAGKRPARRGHHDLASRSAARDDGGHVGVGEHLEGGCWDTVEGDAGCARQTLTEDLRGLANSALGPHECDKWAEPSIQRVNASQSVRAALVGNTVEGSGPALHRGCFGLLLSDPSNRGKAVNLTIYAAAAEFKD